MRSPESGWRAGLDHARGQIVLAAPTGDPTYGTGWSGRALGKMRAFRFSFLKMEIEVLDDRFRETGIDEAVKPVGRIGAEGVMRHLGNA